MINYADAVLAADGEFVAAYPLEDMDLGSWLGVRDGSGRIARYAALMRAGSVPPRIAVRPDRTLADGLCRAVATHQVGWATPPIAIVTPELAARLA